MYDSAFASESFIEDHLRLVIIPYQFLRLAVVSLQRYLSKLHVTQFLPDVRYNS